MEVASQAVHDTREQYHRLATSFDETEGALNEGLGSVRKLIAAHKLIAATATATNAMSIGTGD